MKIRPYKPEDLNDLYAISLATGFAGGDASSLYNDPKLMGHIYVAPYVSLRPELAWVVTDDEGISGYIVGVDDTEAWENQLEREWWPTLRKAYVDPEERQLDQWTLDERRIRMIFHPERSPLHVTRAYPAHMHMNLHHRIQRKGMGSQMLELWLSKAADRGVEGWHVAVNRKNTGAIQFWHRQGSIEIEPHNFSGRTVWMGASVSPHRSR